MKYKNIVKGKFLERPNRFISYCEIDNNIEKVLKDKKEEKQTKTVYVYRSRPVTTKGGKTEYKWDVCGLNSGDWVWTGEKKEA